MGKRELKKGENVELSSLLFEIQLLKDQNKELAKKIETIPKHVFSTSRTIPCAIFSPELSALETIVKYLKENLFLTNKKIAKLVNRSEKTTSQSYKSSCVKKLDRFVDSYSEISFPVDILQNRRLSVLENIVVYLKENYDLTYAAIAKLLHRNQRTIWTIYSRAMKKVAN